MKIWTFKNFCKTYKTTEEFLGSYSFYNLLNNLLFFYKETLNGPVFKLQAQCYYRMKLMVVGYGGRGKTSLLQALKKRVRQNGENPAVTVGVIVDEWKYV